MYEVQDIPLNSLKDNPYDQRKRYGDIESLAASIEQRGLQNPISVIKVDNEFVIVSGHRRAHAFRYLHRETIPAIIRKESTPEDLMVDLAIENLQRKDFSPAEKGATLEQLFYTIPSIQNNINNVLSIINQMKMYEMRKKLPKKRVSKKSDTSFSEEDITKARNLLNMVGIPPNTAIVYLRLCLLPDDIQQSVVTATNVSTIPEGKMGVKSAYELTRITDPEIQRQLKEKAVKDKMTRLELKHVVDEIIEEQPKKARKSITSSSERRTEDDVGAAKLTEDLFELSSKVDSFRSKLPLVTGRLQKVEWVASLDKMKKTCMAMIQNINNLIHDDMSIEGLLEYVNADLEIAITSDLRFTLSTKIADTLKVNEGDVLLLKIEGIKRSTN